MSIGLVRDNFDLNKNAIIENKNKDYWVLDLFDGEVYCGAEPGNFQSYIKPEDHFTEGDVIGLQIDLERGYIQYWKNAQPMGVAFRQGMTFRKGKVFPLL